MQFRVAQDAYQGPLDLLLRLALERDLPLPEISLARVAQEFRQDLREHGDLPLHEVGDFAVVAARLIRLKAGWRRFLEPEEDDPEAAPERPGARSYAPGVDFLRGHMGQMLLARDVPRELRDYPPEELLEAFRRMRARVRRLARRPRLRPKSQIPFRRVLAALRRRLRESGRVPIAQRGSARPQAVLELLGALELTRAGEAGLDQAAFNAPLFLVAGDLAAARADEEADDGDLAAD